MSAAGRVRALDLLRVVAAVQMVQGHTIDAVLATDARVGTVYRVWLALRGLTSVAFLFAAGLSFQLATLRQLERHLADRAAVARRFARAGSLVLLGYVLRLPLPWPASEPSLAAAIEHSFATDILQCIGVSLALVEALALLVRRAVVVEALCGALGLAALGCSGLASQLEPHGPFLPLLTYLSPRAGSLFPLLPWSGHLLLGVALGRSLLSRPGREARLALAALGFAGSAWLAKLSGLLLCGDHLLRLGCVLGVLWLLSLAERFVRGELPVLFRLSSETLFIYAFHVVLVYGRGLGLADAVGPRLSPGAAISIAFSMIALSFAGALAYRRIWDGLARGAATG